MADFTFRPITEADARAIASWHYDGEYAFYNPDDESVEEDVRFFLDPANGYTAIADQTGKIIGYYCTGEDARVPGGDYSDPDALDLGMGMRPDLTGGGKGHEAISAVIEYLSAGWQPSRFRATVAAFNQRALRLCERAGFRRERTFTAETRQGTFEFVILIRERE